MQLSCKIKKKGEEVKIRRRVSVASQGKRILLSNLTEFKKNAEKKLSSRDGAEAEQTKMGFLLATFLSSQNSLFLYQQTLC